MYFQDYYALLHNWVEFGLLFEAKVLLNRIFWSVLIMLLDQKLIQNDQDLSLIFLCKDSQQLEDYFFDDFERLKQKFLL